MINSPRKIFYLILGLDVLLLFGVGLLVWQIKEEKINLTTSFAQSSLVRSSEEELLTSAWTKLKPQMSILDEYFLSASTTIEFLERLEGTVKTTKTVLKINQAEAKDNLRLNFSIQGNFVAIGQFLEQLERFPYALRLERLDLRVADKGSWRGDFVIIVDNL